MSDTESGTSSTTTGTADLLEALTSSIVVADQETLRKRAKCAIKILAKHPDCQRCAELIIKLAANPATCRSAGFHLKTKHSSVSTPKLVKMPIRAKNAPKTTAKVPTTAPRDGDIPEVRPRDSANENAIEFLKVVKENEDMDTIDDIDDTGNNTVFKTPTKTVKWRRLFSTSVLPVQVKNRFEPIAGPSTENHSEEYQNDQLSAARDEEEFRTSSSAPIPDVPRSRANAKNNSKPPPIIVPGHLSSQKELFDEIKTITNKGVTIKYAKRSVILYFEDILDWAATKRALEQEKQEFHTYTVKSERTHAFVLRGMDGDVKPDEIINGLKEENFRAKECFLMKGTARPLYLVVFAESVSLNNIRRVRQLCNVRVSWELRRSPRELAQCRRCQTWGHSSSNCRRKFKCSKCAGEHEITACTATNIICANCSGPHRSFDSKCPVYLYKINQSRPPNQEVRRFIPAPHPVRNAWSGARTAPLTPAAATSGPTGATRTTSRATPSTAPTYATNSNFNFDRDFPVTLRDRGAPPSMASASRSATGVGGETGQFLELAGMFRELNTLANMSELLSAVKFFIEKLKHCNDKISKFQASVEFFTVDINSFNF